jgi:protein involved in polysaccharide export with SLBB domain
MYNKKILTFLICVLSYTIVSGAVQKDSVFDKKIKSFSKLKRFGYDFFSSTDPKSTAPPSAITPDYLIKPGDELIIEISGKLPVRYILQVSGDGSINIPKTGKIYLNGKNFAEAKKKILRQLASSHSLFIDEDNNGAKGSVVDITLGKISGTKVYLTGNVNKRGSFFLKGADTSILTALACANGIRPEGSLRSIQIKHQSGKSTFFDLYDFLIKGTLKPEFKYLKDGDIVFVPVKGKEVYLAGAVKKPGIYELAPKESLNDLVSMAGGVKQNADPGKLQLIRIEPGSGKIIKDIQLADFKSFIPIDMDMIDIQEMPVKKVKPVVEISGEGIRKPDLYELTPEMTLNKLITKAGGLFTDAYKENIVLIRLNNDFSKEIMKINLVNQSNLKLASMDKIIVFSKSSLKNGDNHITIEGHVKNPGKYNFNEGLKASDIILQSGGFDNPVFRQKTYLDRADIIRIDKKTQSKQVIPFSLREVLESKNDIALSAGDTIKIYSFESISPKKFVRIAGAVNKPGKMELKKNMTLEDAIFEANGLAGSADANKIEIGRQDSEQKQVKVKIIKASLATKAGKNFRLQEGDIIIIGKRDKQNEITGKVTVSGAVNTPGCYLLQNQEKISSVIQRCGGLNNAAFPAGAMLIRKGNRLSFNLPIALKEGNNPNNLVMRPDDILFIPQTPSSIKVTGEVLVPQKIAFTPNETPEYYIEKAGNYTPNADKDNTKLILPDGSIKDGTGNWFSSPEVKCGYVIVVMPKTSDGKKLRTYLKQELTKLTDEAIPSAQKTESK